MNDKKRQEIFRHDSRWVNYYNDGRIRIDHWDENPDVIRIGTVIKVISEHWNYTHYEWVENYKMMGSVSPNDTNLLRRLIP